MLLQRLLLNIITTFATAIPLIRSIMAMTVCLCFLLVHMSLRPLRHPAAEFAQTAFQVSGGDPPPPLPRACAVDCRQGWRKLHVLAPSILTTWPPSPVPLPSSLRVSTSLHLYACVCL